MFERHSLTRWLGGFFIAILCLSIPAQADSSPTLRRLEVELLKAEAEYSLRETPEYREALILALEEFANHICLGSPNRAANHSGHNLDSDTKCSMYLKKIIELHPESRTALCIVDGYSSASCLESASREIPISSSNLSRSSYSTDSLSNQIKLKLSESKRKYAGEQTRANRSELTKVYRSVLNEVCAPIERKTITNEQYEEIKDSLSKDKPLDPIMQKILQGKVENLSPEGSSKPTSAESKSYLKKSSSGRKPPVSNNPSSNRQNPTQGSITYDLPNKSDTTPKLTLENLPPSDSPTAKLLERLQALEPEAPEIEYKESSFTTYTLRLLPASCLSHLSELAEQIPSSALPACIRYGKFSPICLRAIENERLELSTQNKTPDSASKSTFSEF